MTVHTCYPSTWEEVEVKPASAAQQVQKQAELHDPVPGRPV